MNSSITRRDAMRLGTAGLVAASAAAAIDPALASAAAPPATLPAGEALAERPFLTSAKDFEDVSRGKPVPHSLKGEALVSARLTADAWRLEIVAEDGAQIQKPKVLADGSAVNLNALLALGKTQGVRFLKAMQCNNIALPLGQGLWEGVPLRDVLALCGTLTEVRRVYYWGFHNDDEKQMFRSSLSLSQVLDTPPGEMPPFLAYRLNGEPIPLVRGGPVRMVVPWAHGFKSVKWLQKIVLTNRFDANDTYANNKNDPESYLKTAAYFEDTRPAAIAANKPAVLRGTAMVGWPGLSRVEYWLRPAVAGSKPDLPDDDAAWASAIWSPAMIDPLPADWCSTLPPGVQPAAVWGFDPAGRPRQWPMRFSIAHWSATLPALQPGQYEVRVRTIDQNGFPQPQPRPNQRTGRNRIQCKLMNVGI